MNDRLALALFLADHSTELVMDAIALGVSPTDAKSDVLGLIADAIGDLSPPDTPQKERTRRQAVAFLLRSRRPQDNEYAKSYLMRRKKDVPSGNEERPGAIVGGARSRGRDIAAAVDRPDGYARGNAAYSCNARPN